MAELVGAELAAKQDLYIEREHTSKELLAFRQEMALFREQMIQVEQRLIIKMGTMFVVSCSILIGFMTYLTSLK